MQPENDKKPFSPKLFIIAGLAALIAGFMAVYVNLSGTGKSDIAVPAANEQNTSPDQSTKTKETSAVTPVQAGSLKGLNKGHMTAFVVQPTPKDLKPIQFTDENGAPKTLKDWSGKVVLLNLWATWCGPCREEMPYFDSLKEKLGSDNFDMVAISIDRGGREKPKKFLEEINIQHLKLYHDPTARINLSLNAFGMPTTILINKDGKEIGRLAGPAKWDSEDAMRLIKAAIAEAS